MFVQKESKNCLIFLLISRGRGQIPRPFAPLYKHMNALSPNCRTFSILNLKFYILLSFADIKISCKIDFLKNVITILITTTHNIISVKFKKPKSIVYSINFLCFVKNIHIYCRIYQSYCLPAKPRMMIITRQHMELMRQESVKPKYFFNITQMSTKICKYVNTYINIIKHLIYYIAKYFSVYRKIILLLLIFF